MRIKELSTLIGAGILSLAAVMVLEKGGSGIPESGSSFAAPDFEDTSSLIEYSFPAPTAEPPAKGTMRPDRSRGGIIWPSSLSIPTPPPLPAAASKVKEMLFESVNGSDPVPANVDAERETLSSQTYRSPWRTPETDEDSPVDLPESGTTTAPATPGTTETTPEKSAERSLDSPTTS
jgi:hypothetical protein